ncbi:hypothetical protein [Streptomyces sp. NPDC059378]
MSSSCQQAFSVPAVIVLAVLRYHQHLAGGNNVSEYRPPPG